jgi:hypothetical protein
MLHAMKKSMRSVLLALTFVCLAIGPKAQAVSPPPDGGYPNFNTAEGQKALFSLTTGAGNTVDGAFSLVALTQGSFNTAIGAGALLFNTADQNTAVGAAALLNNTTGGTIAGTFGDLDVGPNVAVGALALGQNTTAGANTAVGYQALGNMTIGGANLGGFSTAVGFKALASADTSTGQGIPNDAFGYEALAKTTTGSGNVGIGFRALFNNATGFANVAMGDSALSNNTSNFNTALGSGAGANATTGNGNVYIGALVSGAAGESNHTYIGNINITTVSGGGTDTVTVDLSTGLLGHLSSSRRYKEDIQPMDNASQALFALQPVTYRYKKEIDPSQAPAFGLIAEEVAKVNPDLVAHNAQGQPESVHYEMVNAMLLNEFLKEHKAFVEQQQKVQKLEATVTNLLATVKEQAEQIQKVSAQVKVSKPGAQRLASREQ